MLRIGTRGSKLALTQAFWVRDQIARRHPGCSLEMQIIKTSADKDALAPIRSASGRGVFVREIEEALIAGEIDLAVHSMKDMPTRVPEHLQISVIPIREDARDALLSSRPTEELLTLPNGAVVGTGSVRRQAQILAVRPDLSVRDIRGNVDTRIQKLASREFDAIILACAGLNRLGLKDRISSSLEFGQMLPAPGQGALALETRRDDTPIVDMVSFLNHLPTCKAVQAERAFLRWMGGGCNSPIAVHAFQENGMMKIEGLVATPDGKRVIRESVKGPIDLAEESACSLADTILSRGGTEILQSLG